MATDFKYATQSDLEMYFSEYSNFDSKKQLFGWTIGLTNFTDTVLDVYYAHNTGLVTQLFWDSAKADKIAYNTTATATSITTMSVTSSSVAVADSSVFAAKDIIKIDDEYIKVSGIVNGDPDTVQFSTIATDRGLFGSTISAHASSSNIYTIIDESTDIPDADSASDAPSWVYDSDLDLCLIVIDSKDPNDSVIESGQDNTTYFDQMLVNASMELNSLLDKRFPMPLPKFAQFDLNTSYTSSGVEYDAIIIKSTCYIVASNLMRQSSRGEEADYYYNLVVNPDGTGIVDRLNKGESKLAFETDHQDSKGKVREITKSGTMSLIETGGAYIGNAFELFEIECTTGGAYGTAEVSVKSYGSDKLLGTTTTGVKVTGGLQHVLNGWYARWQGASMTSGDKWEVQLYSDNKKVTNSDFGSVELYR